MNRAQTVRLARTAHDEAQRALTALGKGSAPRPFYISHLIRDERAFRVDARFGAIFAARDRHERFCFTDVRVGSYRHDQVQHGGLRDNSKEEESYGYVEMPCGDETDGFRHALWKLTDARYREAHEAYWRKKTDELTYVDRYEHLPSFERRAPIVDLTWHGLPKVDRDYWTKYVIAASRLFKKFPRVKGCNVHFQALDTQRIFASTEGTMLVQGAPQWTLEAYIWHLSESGDGIPWTLHHAVADPREMPTLQKFQDEIRNTLALLDKLAKAPAIRSFSGPVLLEPRPAGLLIHEAVGHRLEGNRLLSSGEGQTFCDSVGNRILPEFLSLIDDPTMRRFGKRSLIGSFDYDDEGTPAQNTMLVERGVLRAFLSSRAGIAARHKSNGHARNSYHQRPVSRMGVTYIKAEEGLDEVTLKQRLLQEISAQKAPFGIRVIHADSGETATEGYDFQAFLGEINLAARVFPDGREEWIRGVNFVGTPLNAVRSIIAAGNRYEIDNAHCGAESGYVPVSTVSSALLLSRLELQSKSDNTYAQYTYPMPWDVSSRRARAR